MRVLKELFPLLNILELEPPQKAWEFWSFELRVFSRKMRALKELFSLLNILELEPRANPPQKRRLAPNFARCRSKFTRRTPPQKKGDSPESPIKHERLSMCALESLGQNVTCKSRNYLPSPLCNEIEWLTRNNSVRQWWCWWHHSWELEREALHQWFSIVSNDMHTGEKSR